eukprot:362201-Chlamydomonas_euryale.AAC.5
MLLPRQRSQPRAFTLAVSKPVCIHLQSAVLFQADRHQHVQSAHAVAGRDASKPQNDARGGDGVHAGPCIQLIRRCRRECDGR